MAEPSKSNFSHRFKLISIISIALIFFIPIVCFGSTNASFIPFLKFGLKDTKNAGDVAVILQILLLLTALSLLPAILIMLTSFTRIVIVLSILRQAIGTHQIPQNQIIIGLALFLTIFIMTPIWEKVNQQSLQPYLAGTISQQEALVKATPPLKEFMFRQTREKDLALFVGIANIPRPKNKDDIPISILIPSFVISELKTAFQIGFLLYVPFLIIDLVVASILLSMGMMMLPPVMISLPFKLMLFVLVDGWYLIVGSLVKSFS